MTMRLLNADLSAGTTLTNSTTETALCTYTFPAYALQAGKVYQFEAAFLVPDQNSTDTLLLKGYLGATGIGDTAIFTVNATDVADGDLAVVRGTLVVRSVGSAGVVAALSFASDADAATEAAGAHYVLVSSLDTTAALNLVIAGTWSVAHADNQVASQMFNVYEIV